MPGQLEHFNLDATLALVGQAFAALICHIGFDAAYHGLIFAALIGVSGIIMGARGLRFGKPLVAVCKKLSLFCVLLITPGLLCLAITGQLPSTGTFQISSAGFIAFWSLICLHLSAEEMNYQWF